MRCGGGVNHRMGLSDMALVKDNHVAAAGGVAAAYALVRALEASIPVEIEVDTLDGLREAIDAGADEVLLDNFDLESDTRGGRLSRPCTRRVRLEASGGLTVEVARRVAETGVDFIAVGELTHSARVLDLGLDLRDTSRRVRRAGGDQYIPNSSATAIRSVLAGRPSWGSPPGPNASSGGIVITRRPPMRIPSRPVMSPGTESPSTSSIRNGSPLSQVLNRTASVVTAHEQHVDHRGAAGRDRLARAHDDVDDRQLGRPDGGLDGEVGRRVRRVRGGDHGARFDHERQCVAGFDHRPAGWVVAVRQFGGDVELAPCPRPGSRSGPAPNRR